MRTNKIHNIDLFTQFANDHFKKHIKTKSKIALEILKEQIDWSELVTPIELELDKNRSKEPAGRRPFSVLTIVGCFMLQSIYGLSDPCLEEEIAD
ncbi:IS5/IS1182 family transposase, partial [bacterium]|nr:IS5/IS1182 family transposase [bacterium]